MGWSHLQLICHHQIVPGHPSLLKNISQPLTKNSYVENYDVIVKNLHATSSFENSCVILNLYFCILNNCVPSINKTLPTDFTIDIFGRSVSMTIFNLSHPWLNTLNTLVHYENCQNNKGLIIRLIIQGYADFIRLGLANDFYPRIRPRNFVKTRFSLKWLLMARQL